MERLTVPGSPARGFAYIALLIVVAILGASLAGTSVVWQTVQQRDKEKELLYVGNQFRRAITQYYESSPGDKKYPPRLEDLLGDPRSLGERRYLRQVYRDPMTNQKQWGIVYASEGGIMGIHSLSQETPIKRENFRFLDRDFENKASYADWKFVYVPPDRKPLQQKN